MIGTVRFQVSRSGPVRMAAISASAKRSLPRHCISALRSALATQHSWCCLTGEYPIPLLHSLENLAFDRGPELRHRPFDLRFAAALEGKAHAQKKSGTTVQHLLEPYELVEDVSYESEYIALMLRERLQRRCVERDLRCSCLHFSRPGVEPHSGCNGSTTGSISSRFPDERSCWQVVYLKSAAPPRSGIHVSHPAVAAVLPADEHEVIAAEGNQAHARHRAQHMVQGLAEVQVRRAASPSGSRGNAGLQRLRPGSASSRLRGAGPPRRACRTTTGYWNVSNIFPKSKSTRGHALRRNPLICLAPQPGLEPGTYGLTVRRSTD